MGSGTTTGGGMLEMDLSPDEWKRVDQLDRCAHPIPTLSNDDAFAADSSGSSICRTLMKLLSETNNFCTRYTQK
jgi:hypothetical protein